MRLWACLVCLSVPCLAAPTYNVYSGQYAATVAGITTDGATSPFGAFAVPNVPAGATVEKALLVYGAWFSSNPVSASLKGHALGSAAAKPTSADFSAYAWDVTAQVTSAGSYDFAFAGSGASYGAALVVVYSHPALPQSEVVLSSFAQENQGVHDLSLDLPVTRAGSARLWIFTQADDAVDSGEQVLFNGSRVAGPLDGNLGRFASLVKTPVSAQAGLNRLTLTTSGDWYAWQLAVLQVNTTAVPEPATAALAAAALALFLLRRAKRN